jgi:hypothetical protein
MGQGKDRGKHDGGRDASGRIPPGAKHPDSPRNPHQGAGSEQPESGPEGARKNAGERVPPEEE